MYTEQSEPARYGIPAVAATATTMGSPVPEGWEQPRSFPVKTYDGLREAVLYYHGNLCQHCLERPGLCAKVESAGSRAPENLVVLCQRCIGGRSKWEVETINYLKSLALQVADEICRMTGWGLERPRRTRTQPKRAVKRKQGGRPRTADSADALTVRVTFRISNNDKARLADGDPDFQLNEYARARTLGKRPGDVEKKKLLNSAGVRVKDCAKGLRAATDPLVEQNPDHPVVQRITAEIDRLESILTDFSEILFKL